MPGSYPAAAGAVGLRSRAVTAPRRLVARRLARASVALAAIVLLAIGSATAALAQEAPPVEGGEESEAAGVGRPPEPDPHGEGGGGEEGGGRYRLFEDPEETVGLALAGVTVLLLFLALDNARRQLKGERPQASGKWRPR